MGTIRDCPVTSRASGRSGRHTYLAVLLAACLFVQAGSAIAESSADINSLIVSDISDTDADVPAIPADDAESSGDELLLFEYDDMNTVVSSTRRPEKVKWLSMPVGIISAKDIHYGGQTNIPEALQYATGVDVLRINRNRVIVGIRGMHEYYSDRLKTLIDGRSADSILTGGANMMRLPVPMEDIARIEVVRGPAGGVWGRQRLHRCDQHYHERARRLPGPVHVVNG